MTELEKLRAENERLRMDLAQCQRDLAAGVDQGRKAIAAYRDAANERDGLLAATEGYIGVLMHAGNCKYDGDDRSLCDCGIEKACRAVDAARKATPAAPGK